MTPLTQKDLNRALLARQLLLTRSRLGIAAALERVAGLQTQYAPSGYVGLWSRLVGFRRARLTNALERGQVVQATLMRATIHMVSARDYLLFTSGVRQHRRDWWTRVARRTYPRDIDYERVAGLLAETLAGGPRRRDDLIKVLEGHGYDRSVFEGAQVWLEMVRVPPSGTWERRRADIYALADQWVGENPFNADQGTEHLIRRYLGGFGPAPIADISNWAGVPGPVLEEAAGRLNLRRRVTEDGIALFDSPGSRMPDGDTPAPVRFLPTWDANLLVHVRRAGVLPEIHRPRIFSTRNPQSVGTVLIGGSVGATWKLVEGEVKVDYLGEFGRGARSDVAAEAERLTAFHLR